MLKRPLLVIVCIYSLGILYGQFFNWKFIIIMSSLVLLTLFLLIKSKQKTYLLITLILLIFVFGACFSYLKIYYSSKCFEPFSDQTVNFSAEVVSQPDIRDKKVNYTVVVKKIRYNNKDQYINSQALLSVYAVDSKQLPFNQGSLVEGTGRIILPSPARNTGGFNYKQYLASQNIYCTIKTMPDDITAAGQSNLNPFIAFSLYLRNNIIRIFDSSLPYEEAGLLKGVVIGERSGLSERIEQNFNTSGLTHLLCVSGANIAYIAGACIFLFSALKLKTQYSNLVTIFILILFTYITGCSPSVVRAAIMGIMLLLAGIFERKSDVLTSISAACLLILLYNPLAIYDIGFQLSFAGTIGIVLFYKSLTHYLRFLPKLVNEVLSVSLAAQLTVDPLIALYFNKISIIALISNLIAVPITGAVTILGFIMSITGQFALILAKLTGGLTYFFLAFMLWVSDITSKVPFATIQVITPSLLFLVLYYAFLYFLLWYIPQKHPSPSFYKVLYTSLIICIASWFIMASWPQPLQVSFVDVGQGDCNFIKTPHGKACLIDGGGTYPGSLTSFDPSSTVIPFILDSGISSIDLAILSHAHGDHIQGLIKVVESLNVKKLVIGPQFELNADLSNLLSLCKKKKVQVVQVTRGDTFNLDGIEFRVIHPSVQNNFIENSSLNNNSLVLMLTYENTRVLFTGDIENQAEQEIMDLNTVISADILKVGHHGSPGSTSQSFLEKVSPSVCIISVGKNNFGHPSKIVIDKIHSIKSKLFRTDQNGGVNLTIYKDRFIVKPAIY